jgi:hypothetical protein
MAYLVRTDKDDVYDVLAYGLNDHEGRGLAQWLQLLGDHDLFAEILIHVAERRHWPDYAQIVRLIDGAVEGALDDLRNE